MRKIVRIFLYGIGILVGAALVVPFLVPVPPMEGTVPPEKLAFPDSRFVEVNGINVHYQEQGAGEPVLILMHGFLASTFSWREVIDPFSKYGRVIAFDRPGFGLTSRPVEWTGASPYAPAAQVDLAFGLMDRLGVTKAILVGNSAGGTLAVQMALAHPERVQALILVDPALSTRGGPPAILRPLLSTPQARRLGPLFVRNVRTWGLDFGRSAWHDPSQLTPEIWDGYTRPLQVENWDRGLWNVVTAGPQPDLSSRLPELKMPTLVVTGDDDRIVPTAGTIRLAGQISQAHLAVLPSCGHVPQEECPAVFLDEVASFLEGK